MKLTDVASMIGESIGPSAMSLATLIFTFVGISVGQFGFSVSMPFVLLVSVPFVRLEEKNVNLAVED